jgi:hypothetical protein
MKKKLTLNKKNISTLTPENMKNVQGGKEQFLSIFNCNSKAKCIEPVTTTQPEITFQYCPGPTTISYTCP